MKINNIEEAEVFINDVGPGWQNIVRCTLKAMLKAGWNGELLQIKEKFGGLRLYIGSASNEVFSLIDLAEDICEVTCENCGRPGKARPGSWIKTLCDGCYDNKI